MTDPQSPTSHSSYSFSSLRYFCSTCQRPFSQLSTSENPTSQAHCPRCDTLSDPQSQPNNPTTPLISSQTTQTSTPQPSTSSPQGQNHPGNYIYITEMIETPFGGVFFRTVGIPVPPILQQVFTPPADDNNNSNAGNVGNTEEDEWEDTDEGEDTAAPEQATSEGNRSEELTRLLESLHQMALNASTQQFFSMFGPIFEERILEEFLRNDPNQYGPPPASEEAIKKLEEIKFDVGEKEGSELCCSICKEEYLQDESLVKLPCKHEYHGECVNTWLAKHNSCPMCRQAI